VGVRFGGELFTCHQFLPKKKEKRGKMTGREIVQMAFDLQESPRVPVTLIGGGAWEKQVGSILPVGCDFAKDVPLENMLTLMSLKEKP
jgi:hypothetical protein